MERNLFGGWKLPKYKKGDIVYDEKENRLRFLPGVFVELQHDFPEIFVAGEIKKAERWLLSHGPKRNYTKFFLNWLGGAKPPRVDEQARQTRSSGSRAPIVNPKTGEAKAAPIPSLSQILGELKIGRG